MTTFWQTLQTVLNTQHELRRDIDLSRQNACKERQKALDDINTSLGELDLNLNLSTTTTLLNDSVITKTSLFEILKERWLKDDDIRQKLNQEIENIGDEVIKLTDSYRLLKHALSNLKPVSKTTMKHFIRTQYTNKDSIWRKPLQEIEILQQFSNPMNQYVFPQSIIDWVCKKTQNTSDFLPNQKLLAHLDFLAPKHLQSSSESRHVFTILNTLDEISQNISPLELNRKLLDLDFEDLTAFKKQAWEITWPFMTINTTNELQSNPSISCTEEKIKHSKLDITKTYVPNSKYSEDFFQIQFGQEDNFCVVVADGASQSAYGHIAAQCIVTAFHAYYKYATEIIDESHVKHIVHMAKRDAEIKLHEQKMNINNQLSDSMLSILNYRIQHYGSQAVFGVVIRHHEKLLCCWAGNVRIIVDSHALDKYTDQSFRWYDARFTNDGNRFSSQSEDGLIGELQYELINLSSPFSIAIFSDALESVAQQIEAGTITESEINACARLDDVTCIQIRST